MLKNKIVCFDVDSTLLIHPEMNIPQSAVDAINEIRKVGNIIAIATGRDLTVRQNPDDVLGKIKPDFIVHCNGEKVTHGDDIIFSKPIDKRLLKNVLDFAEDKNICIGTHHEGIHYFVNDEYLKSMNYAPFEVEEDIYKSPYELLNFDIYSLGLRGDSQQIELLKNKFSDLEFYVYANNSGADVVQKGSSKKTGMDVVLDFTNKNWNDVIAFGDGSNDIDIIKAAKIGVAMGNAQEKVKLSADYITKDIREDGIEFAIRYIL